MPRIVVVGGVVVGLSAAMMLAKQGLGVAGIHEAFDVPGPSRADLLTALA